MKILLATMGMDIGGLIHHHARVRAGGAAVQLGLLLLLFLNILAQLLLGSLHLLPFGQRFLGC